MARGEILKIKGASRAPTAPRTEQPPFLGRAAREDRTQILTEHPAEAFEVPPGKSDRFTLVEFSMFAGRSLAAKRRLYRALVTDLGRLGIPPSDVLIVLHEVPLENWGIRGGTPASEADLGFEVGV